MSYLPYRSGLALELMAAIFGGFWELPLRYIFMDEAGTSANEPVTVVVGIIANADEHVMAAEKLALEAMQSVPAEIS